MVCIKVALSAIKKKYEAEFTITDSEDSLPVSGFVVTVGSFSGSTNAAGQVTFGPLKKGTYSYTALHPDYEDIAGDFTAA